MIDHVGETFVPTCWTVSNRTIIFGQNCFQWRGYLYLSRKVNRHHLIIWGSQNPHQFVGHLRDSPKVNVFYAVSRTHVYGPLFFADTTINGSRVYIYAEALICATAGCKQCHLQQDGAPPHCHGDVTRYLNQTPLGRWIGRGGPIPWPPLSPHLTPLYISSWGFVKDNTYVPPISVDLQQLRHRFVNAIALGRCHFLNKLWDELEYCLDVCRITRTSHIEHL
jgi:hypothetical protein